MSETKIIENLIIKLSEKLRNEISNIAFESVSIEALIDHLLLPRKPELWASIRDLSLACALLSSSCSSIKHSHGLSSSAESAFRELSDAYSLAFPENNSIDGDEKRLLVALMPDVIPVLKHTIQQSSIDKSDEVDQFSAASARAPVELSIAAAYQFRWFVTKMDHPQLRKFCHLLIPCALTALDHWSPEVKGQGMVSLIHIGKHVNASEVGCFGDAILDACCHNIASNDEIWHLVVEMTVLFLTSIHQNNPRSVWYEKILNDMLSHLERQPRNKDRRVAWLQHIEEVFNSLGLLLLAHFRRIFPLFFQWMHADDDETVLLVLKQVYAIVTLTWIRNTPYIERLVDELAALYKGASSKASHQDIRKLVSQILIVLHQCKGAQFEAAYDKHRDDLNLIKVFPFQNRVNIANK